MDKEEARTFEIIGLKLRNYDTIFSEFDPRSYSYRSLSDDFLAEAEKATREKKESLELVLLMPKASRDLSKESIIKKRLKEHFAKHCASMQEEVGRIIKRGIFFVIVGLILMVLATMIIFKFHQTTLLSSLMIIMLEPAGWFFFWEGLAQLVYDPGKKRPRLGFYKKMEKAEIKFGEY